MGIANMDRTLLQSLGISKFFVVTCRRDWL